MYFFIIIYTDYVFLIAFIVSKQISLFQFILIFSWIDMRPTEYGDYVFPSWATGMGWLLSLFSVSAIPFVFVCKVYCAEGPIFEV